MNFKKWLLQSLGFILFICLAQSSWALSCFKGSGLTAWSSKERTQTEKISQQILVPLGITVPGTTLWRSQTYTTTFTCFDSDNQSAGEMAYLYWDPQTQMPNIDKSIQVGVTINGVDYPLVKGQRIPLSAGTVPPATTQNCSNIGISRRICATPQSLTVKYGIYVKATGASPPVNGQIPNSGTYSVFQVDGVGGLNAAANSNFNLYISGLNNIKFVQCNPEVTVNVTGTNGNIVDFGKIVTRTTDLNKIIRRKSFNIKADLTKSDTGGLCNGKVLVASFTTTNSLNGNTILPAGRKDIAIQLFKQNDTVPLILNTPYDLATINNGVASNNFDAGLIQLSSAPAVGKFSATAIVEVTFK
nr:fimbrial protein [Acinetobacter sp. Marseille-Q1620]